MLPKVWGTYDLIFANHPKVPEPVRGRYGHADATSVDQALSGYLKMMGILRPRLKEDLLGLYDNKEKGIINDEEVFLVQIYPTGPAEAPSRKRKSPKEQKILF